MKSISGSGRYKTALAHLGAFLTVSAWGCSFISSKILMEDGGLTPVETYIYRFAAAYFILLFFTFRRFLANSWRDELVLAVCGVCAGSLYFITENYALRLTTTGNVSLLSSISPILTTFMVALFYKQRIKLGVIVGSIIAFAGAGCIIFSNGENMEIHPAGDLLSIAAAFCWAIYSVAIKGVLPNYTSMFVTRKLFFYGVLTALPLLLIQQEPLHLGVIFSTANPQYFLNFLFLVAFCSLGAYLIWNQCLKYLGPVASNNYLYLQPLVTMVVAYFVFGEHIFMLGYIGCALIIGGLVISDKWKSGIRPRTH
ncbi:MAG: DMT family transporter [Muribaculaceae bacterium]|nr:DMT family transporter [Muribaculaceae bacterium]